MVGMRKDVPAKLAEKIAACGVDVGASPERRIDDGTESFLFSLSAVSQCFLGCCLFQDFLNVIKIAWLLHLFKFFRCEEVLHSSIGNNRG